MAIKHIVVHVDAKPKAGLRLETAAALAARFQAHLTAVYLIPEPFLRASNAYHLPEAVVREHVQQAGAEADAVLELARETVAARASFSAVKEVGALDRLPTFFARLVRSADLAVVGGPDHERGGADDGALLEVAFLDTGRPALVIPQSGAPALPPRQALVTWDGSREAARAVHDALPLLAAAEEVVVLTVGADGSDSSAERKPGADIVEQLGRHGIAARLKAVDDGGSIADIILSQAAEEGAELVVMGGYGHSRLRQMMLGGVTRHMLERTTLPLLIAH